ncbi:MAG: UvrD-helicase domain-containing protein, partial [Candidatus Korarchaeota archaeon]
MTVLDNYQLNALQYMGDKIIEAGAGAGKTRVLVENYLLRIGNLKYDFTKIPLITFTEKAGAELRKRIRDELTKIGIPGDRLMLLEKAPVGTIHGFCFDLLRNFPLRSGIGDNTRVLEEIESRILCYESARECIVKLLDENSELSDKLRKIIHAEGYDLYKVVKKFANLLEDARNKHDPALSLRAFSGISGMFEKFLEKNMSLKAAVHILLADKLGIVPENLRNIASSIIKNHYALLISSLDEYCEKQGKKKSLSSEKVAKFRELVCSLKDTDPLIRIFTVGMEAINRGISPRTEPLASVISATKEVVKEYKKVDSSSVNALVDYLVRHMREELETSRDFVEVAKRINEYYNSVKESRFLIDMNDILIKTFELVKDGQVLRTLRGLYPLIMIDEFQDTNELQYEILRKIANELVMVGDPKQSIYRFRGGDITQFMKIYRESQLGKFNLPVNYRSVDGLIDFYNKFFDYVFNKMRQGPPLLYEVDYFPMLSPRMASHTVAVVQADDQEKAENQVDKPVELIQILSKETLSDEELIIMESEIIAERIKNLIAEQKIMPGSIAILLRSTSRAPIYINALIRHGIKYKLLVGKGFYTSQEIADIINFLSQLVTPRDIFRVGLLRSPFAGVSDNALIVDMKELDVPMYKNELKRADSLDKSLSKYRDLVGVIPHSELIRRIVEETGYIAAIGALPDGKTRVANIYKLIELVGKIEGTIQVPLYNLIEYLKEMREYVAREPPAQSEIKDEQTVKIMTIHAAKGLEFDVVFVPSGASSSLSKIDLFYDISTGYFNNIPIYDREGNAVKSPLTQLLKMYLEDMDDAEDLRLMYV